MPNSMEADPRYDKFISLSMDDPSITPTESAGSIWASPFAMILKRDRYRESCKFGGDMPCSDIREAILLYTKCTAFMRNGSESKYHPQSTFSFEMYMNHPSTTETSELLTEIYIPVIRK